MGSRGFILIHLLFALLALSTTRCTQDTQLINEGPAENGDQANGEPFGGGQPLFEELNRLRRNVLTPTLQYLASQSNPYGLCEFLDCPNSQNQLCLELPPNITEDQKSACRVFINAHKHRFLDALRSPDIKIVVIENDVQVNGEEVAARTQLIGKKNHFIGIGDIEFNLNYITTSEMKRHHKTTLTAHEFGHKVVYLITKAFITDEQPFLHFTNGGAFLTFVAQALTDYSRLLGYLDDSGFQIPDRGDQIANLEAPDGSTLNFGDLLIGDTRDLDIGIVNDGPVAATAITLDDVDTPISVVSNTCAASGNLDPDEGCLIRFRLTAAASGSILREPKLRYFDGESSRVMRISIIGQVSRPIVHVGNTAGSRSEVTAYGADGSGVRNYSADPKNPFDGNVETRVASGDVNNDGVADIITTVGPGEGVTPHCKVYDGQTGTLLASFLAFDADFPGGVWIASGRDINGDGFDDVVTGAGTGAGPHVKAYDGATLRPGKTPAILPGLSFFPYDVSLEGGVRVALGDINNDGFADLITGPGIGGSAHIKVFDGSKQWGGQPFSAITLTEFIVSPAEYRKGAFVGSGDVNGDGRDDIITSSNFQVRVYTSSDENTFQSLQTNDEHVYMTTGDYDGDKKDDLVILSTVGKRVNIWSGPTLNLLSGFDLISPSTTVSFTYK